MAIVVYVNGRITGEAEATISVLDHGFLYGEGVYDVVRTYNRTPFLFDRHLQRLRKSASMISLDIPMSDSEIGQVLQKTIDAFLAHPDNRTVPDVYLRILVTRGIGEFSYDATRCPTPSVVIIAKPMNSTSAEIYEMGVKVSIASIVRNHPCSVNPLIKSNNLLNNALAYQEAHRKGAFEAVLRNYRGEIAECSTSNIFVVKDGRASTPPLDAGLLSGITRAFVLQIGGATGVPMEERTLVDTDLFLADECFLTSTTKEIVPIVQVDDRTIGTGKPGPITKKLLAAFREKARELTSR